MRFHLRVVFSFFLVLLGEIFCSVSLNFWGVQAQEVSFQGLPFVTNHNALEYRAGIQNFDIVQDDLGRIYVANNLGLLEYDGKNWLRYGLSNTKVRAAFIGKKGRIYVGSQGDFGFLEPNAWGQLSYVSLADSLPLAQRDFDETWKIFGVGELVYFCTFKQIFVYDGKQISIIANGKRLDITFQLGERLYTQVSGEGLMEVNRSGFEKLPGGDFYEDKRVSNILPYDKERWLISTFSQGLFLYDGSSSTPFEMKGNFWRDEYLINYSTRLKDGNIALATQNSGLFVIDRDGNLVVHVDKEAGLMDLTINYVFEDSQEGIWLAMNNGIARVDLFSPFSLVDDRMGLEGSGYTAVKVGTKVYLGTNNGLFLWENGQMSKVIGTEGQVYSIQVIQGEVIMNHHNGTFSIQGNRAFPIASIQGAWVIKAHPKQTDYFIQGTYTGLSLFHKRNGKLTFIQEIQGFSESSRVMEFDGTTLWIAHGYKGVFKVSLSDDLKKVVASKQYTSAQGFPTDDLINVFRVGDRLIFTANGGVFEFDSQQDRFVPVDEINNLFGYGTVMADLETDALGNVYFIEQSRLGILRQEKNRQRGLHYSPFNKVKRLWNDDLANVIVLDEQHILIGAKQGFIHYQPELDQVKEDQPRVFFREIRNRGGEERLLFSGHGILGDSIREFAFQQNSISFDFGSAHFESEGELQFQYRLLNFEEEWSEWSSDSKKEYTNLREGDYVFQVRAKSIFDTVSEPIEFAFTVRPPFYRSIFAYLVYGLLLGGLLYFGFQWLDKRYKMQALAFEKESYQALRKKDDVIESITQRSEEEIIRLKNAQLQAEIDYKNQELTSSAMNLIQKNKLLTNLKNSLKTLSSEPLNSETHAELLRLVRSIDRDLEGNEHWSAFADSFDQVHGKFITRLKESFPELTPQEVKFSAYIRMNLNTKEIANLLGISVRGVEIGRYRVRKKLGLSRQDNLTNFLLRF
jgi:DNA-binding CsgD family transcriptional regulator/ligand-binding sensor domain-containing protein